MAVPAYATDLTDIYTDGGSWTALGGRVTDPDTDDYIQGASCWSHDPFSTGIEGGVVNLASTIVAGDAAFIWTKADISPALATHAAGGIQALIGNASTALKAFYVKGSDDYKYGGWICIPVDPTKTPSTTIGTPTAVTDYFGVRWNVPATGPSKGYPFKIDAIRHGKSIEITAGEIANPASWVLTAVYDSGNTRQWGLCQPTNTGAAIQGHVYWGTVATAVYSREVNKTIEINDTEWTDTDFTQIIFANAGNDVVWDNVGLKALGTNNRGIIDVTADGAITWTNSVFEGIDLTTLLPGCTFDGSKWLGTNQIDAGGGSLLGANVLLPTVALNTSALLWTSATDPNGKLDGMEFSMGANAHHAIEFGLTSPLTMTLTDVDFSGFGATDNANDSHFHIKRTSGTVTINLSGCTSGTTDFSYRSDGATVVLVLDQYSFAIKCPTGGSLTIFDDEIDNSNNLDTILQGPTTTTGADVTYSHSGTANDVVVQFFKDGYEEINVGFALTNAAQSLDLNPLLIIEENI